MTAGFFKLPFLGKGSLTVAESKKLKINESIIVTMQPMTKRLLVSVSIIGVPVRRMQKTCPQGANSTTLQPR